MQEFRDLPGPAAFVRRVVKKLRGGSSVVLRFPARLPDGLETELRKRCNWGQEWTSLHADDAGKRRCLLGRALADLKPPVPARELLRSPRFQSRIIWIHGIRPEGWLNWRDLLSRYSDACRNQGSGVPPSVFVVPLCGQGFNQPELTEVSVHYCAFRDVVHRDDLFMLALREKDLPDREHRFLVAATVAHVAQWDVGLAKRLIGARLESILRPWAILEADATERGWSKQTPETWEAGTVDGPTARPLVHSSLLCAKGRLAELNRRLWAAQASALLPMVSDRQAEIVREFGAAFKLPLLLSKDEGQPASVSSLDHVELRHLVRYREELGAPRAAVNRASPLNRLRNKLAHYELLDLATNEWRDWKLLSGRL